MCACAVPGTPCGDRRRNRRREARGMPVRIAAANGSRRSACASSTRPIDADDEHALGPHAEIDGHQRRDRPDDGDGAGEEHQRQSDLGNREAAAESAPAGIAVAAAAPRSASTAERPREDHIGTALKQHPSPGTATTADAAMARESMAISPAPYMRTGTHRADGVERPHGNRDRRQRMPLPRRRSVSATI